MGKPVPGAARRLERRAVVLVLDPEVEVRPARLEHRLERFDEAPHAGFVQRGAPVLVCDVRVRPGLKQTDRGLCPVLHACVVQRRIPVLVLPQIFKPPSAACHVTNRARALRIGCGKRTYLVVWVQSQLQQPADNVRVPLRRCEMHSLHSSALHHKTARAAANHPPDPACRRTRSCTRTF